MNILDKIIFEKKQEVKALEKRLKGMNSDLVLQNTSSTRDFQRKLIQKRANGEVGVIAEIKKASPSRGVIKQDFFPTKIAESYTENGACCLSVLTDEKFFQGDIEFIKMIKKVSSLPILRKDFIINESQIYESRIYGADCILLIASILGEQQLHDFENLANQLDLDVLVEVHNKKEFDSAIKLKTSLIGINNRNLKTFETSLLTSIELAKESPSNKIIITESGIHTKDDVNIMKKNNINTFLVGEALMRAKDPGIRLRELFY